MWNFHLFEKIDWCVCLSKDTCTSKPWTINIVAAFRGMHVSPVKHSCAWLPRKCDYLTDTRTDGHTHRQTPDKVISMCGYALHATQKPRSSEQEPPPPILSSCLLIGGFIIQTTTLPDISVTWWKPRPWNVLLADWLRYLIIQTTPLPDISNTWENPHPWNVLLANWPVHYSDHTPTWHIWHLREATPLEYLACWLASYQTVAVFLLSCFLETGVGRQISQGWRTGL